jgi:hypothetical protein
MRLPTVKIKADTKLGYMIINESDFNKSVHELYQEKEPDKEENSTETETEEKPRRGRPSKKTNGEDPFE